MEGGILATYSIDEACEIVAEHEEWEYASCSCHMGHPPCAKCTSQPSEEMYKEASQIIEQFEKENDPMNKLIIDMYPVTKDAVLVQKWFGEKISNEPLVGMLLKGKEADLLKEAKRLEVEETEAAQKA